MSICTNLFSNISILVCACAIARITNHNEMHTAVMHTAVMYTCTNVHMYIHTYVRIETHAIWEHRSTYIYVYMYVCTMYRCTYALY